MKTTINYEKGKAIFFQFGKAHNDYLTYLSQHPNFLNLSKEEIFEYGKHFESEYLKASTYTSVWSNFENKLNRTQRLISQKEGLVDQLIKETPKLEDYSKILKDLNDLVLRVTLKKEALKESEFDNAIVEIEKHVYGNYIVEYDDVEKTGNIVSDLLIQLSIARYSYSFWLSVANDKESAWFNRIRILHEDDIEQSFWGTIRSIARDIWAYVTEDDFSGTEFNKAWRSAMAAFASAG